MLCRLLGHRYRFTADGNRMTWRCQRGCRAAASKEYPTAEQGQRFAAAFDREDRGIRASKIPRAVQFSICRATVSRTLQRAPAAGTGKTRLPDRPATASALYR